MVGEIKSQDTTPEHVEFELKDVKEESWVIVMPDKSSYTTCEMKTDDSHFSQIYDTSSRSKTNPSALSVHTLHSGYASRNS